MGQCSPSFSVLSVFSHVSCQFICVHVFPDVVDPSPYRQPPFFSSPVRSCPSFFLRGAITVPSFQFFIGYQDVVRSERIACFHTLHWTVPASAPVPSGTGTIFQQGGQDQPFPARGLGRCKPPAWSGAEPRRQADFNNNLLKIN